MQNVCANLRPKPPLPIWTVGLPIYLRASLTLLNIASLFRFNLKRRRENFKKHPSLNLPEIHSRLSVWIDFAFGEVSNLKFFV